MRATFAGFNTALSALQANQKRLDITGQNLSNMNTVGYTRQQLNIQPELFQHLFTQYEWSREHRGIWCQHEWCFPDPRPLP